MLSLITKYSESLYLETAMYKKTLKKYKVGTPKLY